MSTSLVHEDTAPHKEVKSRQHVLTEKLNITEKNLEAVELARAITEQWACKYIEPMIDDGIEKYNITSKNPLIDEQKKE
jgi:hypothetical protein